MEPLEWAAFGLALLIPAVMLAETLGRWAADTFRNRR